MLSVAAEAEAVKTLVGLDRPIDVGASAWSYNESLPDSGIREVEEPEDGLEADAFGENEADTRVELMPLNWEDDEEPTRPQLLLPSQAPDPPPTLPGTRRADTELA